MSDDRGDPLQLNVTSIQANNVLEFCKGTAHLSCLLDCRALQPKAPEALQMRLHTVEMAAAGARASGFAALREGGSAAGSPAADAVTGLLNNPAISSDTVGLVGAAGAVGCAKPAACYPCTAATSFLLLRSTPKRGKQ